MAKSKHEKELAREKKKKAARKRVDSKRNANAILEEFLFDIVENGEAHLSPEQVVKVVNCSTGLAEVKFNARASLAMEMVRTDLKSLVNAVADAGFRIWADHGRAMTPTVSVALMQSKDGESEAEIGFEPVPFLIEKHKGFPLEMLTENIDFYLETDLVVWLTGMVTLPHHLVIGKARDGSEFAAVVHEGQWYKLSSVKVAQRYLQKMAMHVGVDHFDDDRFVIPDAHAETMNRVASISGFKEDEFSQPWEPRMPGSEEKEEELLSQTEAVIKSAVLSATHNFNMLAQMVQRDKKQHATEIVLLKEKLALQNAPRAQSNADLVTSSLNVESDEREKVKAPQMIETKLPQPQSINSTPFETSVKPLRERLAAVLEFA